MKEQSEPLVINKEEKTNTVAFLNFDRVNTEWSYFKRQSKKIEGKHQQKVKNLAARKERFKAEYTKYATGLQNGGIQDAAKEEYLAKEQGLIGQVEQRLMNTAQNEVMKANDDGMLKMKKVLKTYAQKHHIKYIVATGQMVGSPILYHEKGLDITNTIIKTLNRKYK